jgi:hypothetical protein
MPPIAGAAAGSRPAKAAGGCGKESIKVNGILTTLG